MVRKLIGNIRGPQGVPGVKGDKGDKGDKPDLSDLRNYGFNGANKINISDITQFGETTPISDYDIENGVLNFNNVLWQMFTYAELKGVKHVFRVEDYTGNPDYYQGLLRVMIKDVATDSTVIDISAGKGVTYTVDLSGRPTQEYRIELRPTNGTGLTGIIEKPMLVEGDISLKWQPSVKDMKSFSEGYVYGTFTGDVVGTLSVRENANLSIDSVSTQEVINNQITLSGGYWLVTLSARFSPIKLTSQILMYVMLNNQRQILLDLHSDALKTGTLSVVVKANQGDKLRFEVGAGETGVSFASLDTNRFTVKKIGV